MLRVERREVRLGPAGREPKPRCTLDLPVGNEHIEGPGKRPKRPRVRVWR
jgi:hypothetical protein